MSEQPRSRRKSPIAWLALLALALIAGGVAFALLPRTSLRGANRFTYSGIIAGQSALLVLDDLEGTRIGRLELADGSIHVLRDQAAVDGELSLSVSMPEAKMPSFLFDPGEIATDGGLWEVRRSRDGLKVDGTWTGGPSTDARELHFEALAGARTLNRAVGAYVANRGRTIAYRSTFPRFLNANELQRYAEHEAEVAVESSAAEFATSVWTDQEDFWWTICEGSPTNHWDREDDWQVTYCSSELVSLLCGHMVYSGGAHPNYYFSSLVFWSDVGKPVSVQLEDFFREDSDWKSRLAAICAHEIGRQRLASGWNDETAGFALEPAIDADLFSVFTVHPSGFWFHFAPYEVGCYAEGDYHVRIPFDNVKDLFRDTGPATALPVSNAGGPRAGRRPAAKRAGTRESPGEALGFSQEKRPWR